MSNVLIFTVDSFTSVPFAGNPAGVCLPDTPKETGWMQKVAAEMNLSETAFLWPRGADYELRWFTPKVEVDLCGHATLASAHVLWQSGRARGDSIAFHTRSGVLTAARRTDAIELDFPALERRKADPPVGLLGALGLSRALFVGANQHDYLVEVESAETVRALQPDFARLREVTGAVRGVIVTARSDEQRRDIISRFFAPGAGIDEDPVTGSAHCALAPYWAPKLGKNEIRAYQASERGGELLVTLRGDRVTLLGKAATILQGTLVV
ncbi:MAG: PhzF family phenazine biosynthesis protein [Candidatus Eisenbacteria bacterium]|nr:PhzF family phenazine biosynthesis protein [Candidatus Eisenbacteria bacterium]